MRNVNYDTFPSLDGIVGDADVSQKGGGKFAASYVNWAKTSALLREHAPGWQPTTQPNADGGMLHEAPDGTFFLMIGFEKFFHRHCDAPEGEAFDEYTTPRRTQCVPHAIMDHTMKAKKNPDARDISDAFVRGTCKAAALLFGLGWQMWSKDDPLERDEPAPVKKKAKPAGLPKPQPFDSVEHALESLGRCADKGSVNIWTPRVRASGYTGIDRDNLIEAMNERLAQFEE